MVPLSRKFRAPRNRDVGQWDKVQYLVEHGFVFQSVYKNPKDWKRSRVGYPKSLAEAKEFIKQYKDQALKNAT